MARHLGCHEFLQSFKSLWVKVHFFALNDPLEEILNGWVRDDPIDLLVGNSCGNDGVGLRVGEI